MAQENRLLIMSMERPLQKNLKKRKRHQKKKKTKMRKETMKRKKILLRKRKRREVSNYINDSRLDKKKKSTVQYAPRE
jgi:hypothetical protein